jgi:hypothetical protein
MMNSWHEVSAAAHHGRMTGLPGTGSGAGQAAVVVEMLAWPR